VTALWPTAGVLIAAVVAVGVLALRAPVFAFIGVLVMFGFEGSIKMRLELEDVPSAIGVGAVLLDVALLVALAGLLVSDRGSSLRLVWQRAGRPERVVLCAIAGWVALAVVQIPFSGSLSDGIEGFRLIHLYVPALLGGVVLAARTSPDRLAQLLLCAIAPIAAYAAFRGLVGPTENESQFVQARTNNFLVGELPKNSGSFTSSFGMASFLVPAGVFALVLGYLVPRLRALSAVVFVLTMVGLIASYVRTALVAIVAGSLALAGMMLLSAGVSSRRRLYATGLIVVVIVGGYGAMLIAAAGDEQAEKRAESLLNPLDDYSVKTRFDIWEASIDKVIAEPAGTGLGTVGRATVPNEKTGRARATEGRDLSGQGTYTDNSYLLILQEQGFLGGLLFVVGVVGLAVLCARRLAALNPLERPLGTAALLGFVSFLVLFLMGDYVEQPGKLFAWTLLGIATWESHRP
jgi:O-antigen ligase